MTTNTQKTGDYKLSKNPLSQLSFVMIMILPLIMAGCNDDLSVTKKDNGSIFTGLSIRIPDPHGYARSLLTRSDEFQNTIARATADEAAINNLYLITVPEVISPTCPITIVELTDPVKQDNFNVYSIDIEKGKYHFYIFANFDKYLNDKILPELIIDKTNENGRKQIKNISLNFNVDQKLKPGDLPMFCDASEIKISNIAVGNNYIEIKDNEATEITADLKFLCSKVRYTILFDKSESGHSINFSSIPEFNNEVCATNIPSSSSLSLVDNNFVYFDRAWKLQLEKYKYPENGIKYPETTENMPESNLETEYDGNPDCIAWQGIAYLPENNPDLTDGSDNRTLLHLLTNGENGKEYSMRLVPSSPAKGIERGKMYDVVALLKDAGESELQADFSISNWSLLNLYYDLHGPFFLNLEKTFIEIESGETVSLRYDSDTEISYESPQIQIGEESIDFYVISIDESNNTIEIRINEKIPYFGILDQLNDRDEYNYFYVIAGNLKKKIEVRSLTLKPFFNIFPSEVNIELREYITKGEYCIKIPVNFTSNFTGISLNLNYNKDNSENFSEEFEHFPFADSQINSDIYITVNDKGKPLNDALFYFEETSKGTINIVLPDINNGSDFWKTDHHYTLMFHVDNDNGTDNDIPSLFPLKVNIRKYSMNYVIHFKDKNRDWSSPHLLISKDSKTDIFENYNGLQKDNIENINWLCSYCNEKPSEETGFIMIPEGDGWWKFIISGIMDPWNTFLSFTDCHNKESFKDIHGFEAFQYPFDESKRIQLFDFPGNEGWLLYDSSVTGGTYDFISSKPDKSSQYYRIYWPSTFGHKIKLQFSNNSTKALLNDNIILDGADSGMGYYFSDFTMEETSFDYILWYSYPEYDALKNEGGYLCAGKLNQFINKVNNIYCGYLDLSITGLNDSSMTHFSSGLPQEALKSCFDNGDLITVKWRNSIYEDESFNYLYIEGGNWKNDVMPGVNVANKTDDYWIIENMEYSGGKSDSLNLIISSEDGSKQSVTIRVNFSDEKVVVNGKNITITIDSYATEYYDITEETSNIIVKWSKEGKYKDMLYTYLFEADSFWNGPTIERSDDNKGYYYCDYSYTNGINKPYLVLELTDNRNSKETVQIYKKQEYLIWVASDKVVFVVPE